MASLCLVRRDPKGVIFYYQGSDTASGFVDTDFRAIPTSVGRRKSEYLFIFVILTFRNRFCFFAVISQRS